MGNIAVVYVSGSSLCLALWCLYGSVVSLLRGVRNERENLLVGSLRRKLVTLQWCIISREKTEEMSALLVEFSETVMFEARIWQEDKEQVISRR